MSRWQAMRRMGAAGVVWAVASAAPVWGLGAADEKSFADRWVALATEGQPAEGANAVEAIARVAALVRERTAEIVKRRLPDVDPRMVPLNAVHDAGAKPEEVAAARVVIEELLKTDIREQVAQAIVAPRWITKPDEKLLMATVIPALGEVRQIARFQSGRMALALESRDWADWSTAFDETLLLGRRVSSEPMLIAALVGVALQAVAFENAQRAILSGAADEAMLARMSASIERHTPVGIERALKGERLMGEDATDFVYRTGRDGMAYLQNWGQAKGDAPARQARPALKPDQPLGPGMPSFNDQMAAFARYYDALDARAPMTAKARRADEKTAQELVELQKQNLLLGILTPAADSVFRSRDQYQADVGAMRTMIALERYRRARGEYPAALGALVPEFLAEVPKDPYTGEKLGYLGPKAGGYEGGRAYVLYAAGVDAADDGGNVRFDTPHAVNAAGATGMDFLLNRVAGVPAR